MKKTRIPNPVENHVHIKCNSSSSPIKSPSNSFRYNYEKICSRSTRPKTMREIRKNAIFLKVINKQPFIYKFLKDLTSHRKKTNRAVVFSHTLFPRNSTIWKTRFLQTHIEEFGYIKYNSSSSPIKSPSNTVRYNYQKICSRSARPKTMLEISKKAIFLKVINKQPFICKCFRDFTSHRKKTNTVVAFSHTLFPRNSTIWKTRFL